jgi:capsular polysaccharide transport system permease protein
MSSNNNFTKHVGRVRSSGWTIQLRVLAAVFSREIDVQSGRIAFGFVLEILEPLFHIGVICLWHYMLRVQPVYGSSIVLFISTGIYPIFVFVHLSSRVRATSVSAGHRRFPIEGPLDFIISGTGMIMFAYVLVGIVLFVGLAIFSTAQAIPFEFSVILESVLALACLGFGIGLCNAVIQRLTPIWHYFWGAIARALILFSGALYVADFLPVHLREVLAWNPVLHAVELFRQGFYPYYPTLIYDGDYMWGCALAPIVVGLCLQRLFRRKFT